MISLSHMSLFDSGLLAALLIVGAALIALMLDRRRVRPVSKLIDQEHARLLQRFADVQTREYSEGLLATLHAAEPDDVH